MYRNTISTQELIEDHREYGDPKLAEALEYVKEHEDEWEEGAIEPKDLDMYDRDVALYILNCIDFGIKWRQE